MSELDESASSPPRNRQAPLYVMAVPVIGITCLVISLVCTVRSASFSATALQTPGTVIDLIDEGVSSMEPGRLLRPKVEFVVDGVSHVHESQFSDRHSYRVGQSVMIEYQKGQPQLARICDVSRWFFAVCFGTVGAALTMIGFGLWSMWSNAK